MLKDALVTDWGRNQDDWLMEEVGAEDVTWGGWLTVDIVLVFTVGTTPGHMGTGSLETADVSTPPMLAPAPAPGAWPG